MTEVNVEQKMQEVFQGVTALQTRIDEVKGRVDAVDVEMIKKAGEDAAKALEAIQQAKAADKGAELLDRIKDLENVVAKGGAGDQPQAIDHDMARYLRKGVPVDVSKVEAAAEAFARKHLYGADEREIVAFKKDMLAASGPDGGYFITADRSNRIIQRLFETSPLRGVANVETTVSDVKEYILDDDEVSAGWVGEVASRPDTDTPQIGLIKIPVDEIYAQPRATQKMLDDAGFDIEGWLTRKVADKIGRTENTAFVTGDGSAKPKGFLSYSAWASAGVYERNKVEQITSATSGTFTADDLIGLKDSLLEAYQARAVFGMQRATFTDVAQLKDTYGQYLLNPQILMQGATKMLLGADVVFMADMPAVAANALSIVVADFQEFYTIVDRFDIRVLRDPYTAKPYIKFYTTKRTGGAVTNYEAGKILKIKA